MDKTMFDVSTYLNRRHNLRTGIDSGIILLMGNDESPMNYTDNPFHYRQDSTFLYYFGLSHSGLAAVIDIDEGKEPANAQKRAAEAPEPP